LLRLAAAAARALPAPFKRGLYRLGPLSRGLRDALNRAAPSGLSEVTVAAGGLAGARLLLDLHSEKDYWLGTYEMDLQQAITDWVEPGNVIYDLGANVGYVSLLLARATGPQGRVFAFEPLPANQERLRRNLALNPQLHVELVPLAASDKIGASPFTLHESDDMGRLHDVRAAEAAGRQIEVQTTTVDAFAEKNPAPQLVKVDVEGAELLALGGMAGLLRGVRPIVFIELHGYEAGRTCWELLQAANYHLHWMRGDYTSIASVDELKKKSYVVARPA
jgi:FkbM family methyltransferase